MSARDSGGDCSILLTAHACLFDAVQQPDKLEFIGVFDVSEANRIFEPRRGAAYNSPAVAPRKSIMKMKKVKFYATLRGEGLIAALPHTPSC